MVQPKKPRRKQVGKKRKGINKNKKPLEWTLKRVENRIARDQAKAEELRAKIAAPTPARASTRKRAREQEPVTEPETKKVTRTKQDEADQRYAIRYFYRRLESPPEEDWDGYCGTVSEIRRLMGEHPPGAATVRRTLERIQQDDEDLAVRRNMGRSRILSHEDGILVGLMLCEGWSQKVATDMLNAERAEWAEFGGFISSPPAPGRVAGDGQARVWAVRISIGAAPMH